MSESKTPVLDALGRIKEFLESAEDERSKILRKQGWEYTCATPGSYWLWQKKLPDGRTLLVNGETAMEFEEHLCGEEQPDYE